MRGFYIDSPLEWRIVTQGFGENYVGWYQQWGLKGHDAQDMRCDIGTPVLAVCDGEVKEAGIGGDGGRFIKLWSKPIGQKYRFGFVYYHLEDWKVGTGDKVKRGQVIGSSGNTGKYTTAPHLHFKMKKYIKKKEWQVLDYNNGYRGGIDPQPFYSDGKENWVPVDARYGRDKIWLSEFNMRFKNRWLHKFFINELNRNPESISDKELKALVYGGWGVDEVFDPAMYTIWGALKKDDWKKGVKTPIRI